MPILQGRLQPFAAAPTLDGDPARADTGGAVDLRRADASAHTALTLPSPDDRCPMDQHGQPAFDEFDAAYWEERYRSGTGARTRDASPSLTAAVADLRPGRALDAGCGTGGDALWLAAHGWHVTAVDVSVTALGHGRQAASSAGPAFAERIEWVHGDLTAWQPDQTFDLVSSHYVHVPGPPDALYRRLASWVAPGGTLLVVGHDAEHGHGHGAGHAHPAGALLRAEQVVAGLAEEQWDVVVAEPRTHTVRRPDGGGTVPLDDVVVHARRRADPLA